MKYTIRDYFNMLRTGYDVLKIEWNVYKKGGRFVKFDNGKYIKWYYRIDKDGRKEFIPEIKVSGLSKEEFNNCIPKGCKLEIE